MPASATEDRSGRRWYSHGWNLPLSWQLILTVTPKLPRVVLFPLQHLTALVCLVCMPRERRAARRNLKRITGKSGVAGLRLAYRLFYNFSRFMVAYGEMRHLQLTQFRERLIGADSAERTVKDALEQGRGVVLATMHLGQWDLGLKLSAQFGVPVHVVMLSEDPLEVTRYADESRAWSGLRVHQMGNSPLLAVQLMAALRRGEIVGIQLDRPAGGNVMSTALFGAQTSLPTGPVQLAMASGAPLLPIFILLDRGQRYRLLILPPMRFEPGSDLQPAMRQMAEMMESVILRYPDQWFNFYDVWPQSAEPPPL